MGIPSLPPAPPPLFWGGTPITAVGYVQQSYGSVFFIQSDIAHTQSTPTINKTKSRPKGSLAQVLNMKLSQAGRQTETTTRTQYLYHVSRILPLVWRAY